MDDVAYFGISPPMERQDRDGQTVMCDLVAVDLNTKTQVFRRNLRTQGLLNVVSAPHLAESSTYVAVSTEASSTVIARSTLPRLHNDNIAQMQIRQGQQAIPGVGSAAKWSRAWLERTLDESAVDGAWPSSMPRLNMEVKQRALRSKMRSGNILESPIYVHLGKAPKDLIVPVQVSSDYACCHQLLRQYLLFGVQHSTGYLECVTTLHVLCLLICRSWILPNGLVLLQEALAGMPIDWWDPETQSKVSAVIADREKNLNAIKPGVQTMFLIFSSRTYDRIWELPLYTTYFKETLEPLVEALIGRESMSNIIRMQLARMNPGAHIKGHRDTGPWASK